MWQFVAQTPGKKISALSRKSRRLTRFGRKQQDRVSINDRSGPVSDGKLPSTYHRLYTSMADAFIENCLEVTAAGD
jgi:hypothetical protein